MSLRYGRTLSEDELTQLRDDKRDAETGRHMLEVARANGFRDITEAIVKASTYEAALRQLVNDNAQANEEFRRAGLLRLITVKPQYICIAEAALARFSATSNPQSAIPDPQ